LSLFDIVMVQSPETDPGTSTCNCSGCVIVRMQHAVVVRDIPIWLPEQIVILSVMTHFRYAGKITNVRIDMNDGQRIVTVFFETPMEAKRARDYADLLSFEVFREALEEE
ncbi:hypothetical protein T4B_15409, partial [Trichinella pseudospiralis]